MDIIKIVEAQPLEKYRIRLKFTDGLTGDVDLSHLAGKGVFSFWDQSDNFNKVSVVNGRWLGWSDELDLDADSLYLMLTGKKPEDIFPVLREEPTNA